MSRAYWESDSMSPDPHPLPMGATPRSTALDLQLSINQALTKRITTLETDMKRMLGIMEAHGIV